MNFREQIQFTLKKMEHCTATIVHIPNERAIQAVWLHIQLYNLGILVQFPKGKSDIIRINADVFAYLIWMCSPRRYIHIQDPFIASL